MLTMDGTVHGTTGLLMYDNIHAARDYLVAVFGLTAGQLWKSGDGFLEYGEVRAGDQVISLHPAGGRSYRSPRSAGAVTGVTAICVDDVDAHYARTAAAGGSIVCEPVDRPYGIREYGASDPEGQVWWFQSTLG
jgi:MerR family transcriptional regulator, thiopeptide resistance regulator